MSGRIAGLTTLTLVGMEAHEVKIEATVLSESPAAVAGSPAFSIVGLNDARTRETTIRVKSALAQAGVNLNRYDVAVKVDGPPGTYDVAIAACVLYALDLSRTGGPGRQLFLGELSLSGSLHPVRGLLPMLLQARDHGFTRAIVPPARFTLADGIEVFGVARLDDLVRSMRDAGPLERVRVSASKPPPTSETYELHEVHGNANAKRAILIAATGGHGLLMFGAPGAGKTALARRVSSVLPDLTPREALRVASVHDVAGLGGKAEIGRPFRAPHHTVSEGGLVGTRERPGELALAHEGVLFLDEVGEFRRSCLNSLRSILTPDRPGSPWPHHALVIMASNRCACGYLGNGHGMCKCLPERVQAWQGRLRDMVGGLAEMSVGLDEPTHHAGAASDLATTADLRELVVRARQLAREAPRPRSVAQTIAYLAGTPDVTAEHKREALLFSGFLSGLDAVAS